MSGNVISILISIGTATIVTLTTLFISWIAKYFRRKQEIHEIREFLRNWKTEIRQQEQGIEDEDITVPAEALKFVLHQSKMRGFRTLVLYKYNNITNRQAYDLINALNQAEVLVDLCRSQGRVPDRNFYWQQFRHFEEISWLRSSIGILYPRTK